jgi:hypothetical protein
MPAHSSHSATVPVMLTAPESAELPAVTRTGM